MKCNIDKSKLRNNNLNTKTSIQSHPVQTTHFYSEGKTDFDAVKQYSLRSLNVSVRRAESGIVNHPFVPINAKDDEFDAYLASAKEDILEASTLEDIYSIVTPMYLPLFFRSSTQYLSLEDYSKCLAIMWRLLEFPNTNPFVSVYTFIDMFKDADKTFLMDEDELEIYNNLPEEIVVYRGINEHGSVNAISWSLDKEQADWFAHRFDMLGTTGSLYQATIKKEYVLAYISREQEVVIDFTKATNIKKIN